MEIGPTGRAPHLVDLVRAIGDQAAGGDEGSVGVDCWKPVPGCQCNDQIAVQEHPRAQRYDQAAIWLACECRDSALDLAGVPRIDWAQLHPKRGATDWMLPNKAIWEPMAESRMTAARLTHGAISLSSSSS